MSPIKPASPTEQERLSRCREQLAAAVKSRFGEVTNARLLKRAVEQLCDQSEWDPTGPFDKEQLVVALLEILGRKFPEKSDQALHTAMIKVAPCLKNSYNKSKVFRWRRKYGLSNSDENPVPTAAHIPPAGLPRRALGERPAPTRSPARWPYFVDRCLYARAARLAAQYGQTVVIVGPRKYGKSTLLYEYVNACMTHEKCTVVLDFSAIPHGCTDDNTRFLTWFGITLCDELELDTTVDDALPTQLTLFVEKYVLRQLNAPVVLAIDNSDRLSPALRDSFFSTLRHWCDRRSYPNKKHLWGAFDLALVTSLEPGYLMQNANCSPFNVGETLAVTPLSMRECQDMNQHLDRPLAPAAIKLVHELTGGHPALVHQGISALITGDLAIDDFEKSARARHGVFHAHWSWLDTKLTDTDLRKTLARFLAGSAPPEGTELQQLMALGVIRRDASGQPMAANRLYTKRFS